METITNLLLIIIMSLAVYGLFVSIRQGKKAEERGEVLLKSLLRDIEAQEREDTSDDNGLQT